MPSRVASVKLRVSVFKASEATTIIAIRKRRKRRRNKIMVTTRVEFNWVLITYSVTFYCIMLHNSSHIIKHY